MTAAPGLDGEQPPPRAPTPLIDAEAMIGSILGNYAGFLGRWPDWGDDIDDEVEVTRRMKARHEAARAALGHLEHFRKVANLLGMGGAGAAPRTILEWRALMPPRGEEEPVLHDADRTDELR